MDVDNSMHGELLHEARCLPAVNDSGHDIRTNDHEIRPKDDDNEIEDEGSNGGDPINGVASDEGAAGSAVVSRKRHQCSECDTAYSKRKYLQQHMLREHNMELPKVKRGRVAFILKPTEDNPCPYKCDQCIKEYTHLRHLTRHKRVHAQTFCDFCQKSFAFYEEHMRKEHDVELPRPFECDICGRAFRAKSTFQAHMKIHREENRVFNCTLCPKAFFQATDLRKHIKSHSNVRPVICDVCGDAFKSAETLKCHMRRHTGDRPYPCKICPRAFTTSNSLMIHQRTHTNEKPYACEECQKRFSDMSTLMVHKRLHTGVSPYCCHICGRRTKQASNLRSHYQHLHKMNDISGRQVRMNAKIFERFTQQEIDRHLREHGDLIALLAQGQEDFNNEQREKSKVTEKMIETMRAPLRPVKREARNDEAKTTVKSFDGEIKIESDASIAPAIETPPTPILVKNEVPAIMCDSYTEVKVAEKPAMAIDISEQIESVFIVEETGPDDEYIAACEKEEYEDDPTDSWMDVNNFGDELNADGDESKPDTEIVKSESSVTAGQLYQMYEQSKEMKKSVKTPEGVKLKKKSSKSVRTLTVCSVCPKRFHRDNYNVHMVEYHSSIERPFECVWCHKQFKKYKHMAYHQRNHYRDERNFICHICGDAFMLNAELTKHIYNRHTDIRPFKCELCEKMFKNQNARKVHMRSHTGEKAFKCSVCFESFSANSSLRLHFRRHTNEKPYVCSYCNKRFADSSTHRQHERIHTGEKPYQCHLCDRRTSQAGNLKSHYRHYHKMVVKHVRMEAKHRF